MNPPVILGIIGSGKGSNCRAIIEAIEGGQLNARVGIVISDVESAPILSLAVAHGIPSFHLPPGKFKTKLDPSREIMLVEALQQYRVSLVVLAGYMRLVKEPMLEAFPRFYISCG